MRAAVFQGVRDIRIEDVPDAAVQAPTDAVVRISHGCICGSDLWPYNGVVPKPAGSSIGHELMGVVEEVGSEVRSVAPGDVVLSPFTWSDGTCRHCQRGLPTSCRSGGFFGSPGADGGQGEAARIPQADGTLVKVPAEAASDDALALRLLPLTDVLATGHHAAVSAGVTAGSTVAVVGDGAVGLCAVLAAARLGAERIVLMGRHGERTAIAERFGATDVVAERDKEGVAKVRELVKGGVDAVCECVGAQSAFDQAMGVVRDGGTIGYVGVPAGVAGVDISKIFRRNVAIRGGIAPARAYIPELLVDVLAGRLDASPVFDRPVDLDGVPEGYVAMAAREVTKVVVRP